MKRIYHQIEKKFEQLTKVFTVVSGNSITFLLALCVLTFWICHEQFWEMNLRDKIRDVILAVTFLSLFIIQKSFNRFSALLHLKVNELVNSNETASNAVIHAAAKTEHEIMLLSKEYMEEKSDKTEE